jgi:hypothetical protein
MNKYHQILQLALNSEDEGAFLSKEDAKILHDYIKKLEKDSLWLGCLVGAGVDNWEGCEYAAELLEQQ